MEPVIIFYHLREQATARGAKRMSDDADKASEYIDDWQQRRSATAPCYKPKRKYR
jgi:hypothetical protein